MPHSDSVGAVSVLVLGTCHALCRAPRLTQDMFRACGQTPRWRGLRHISVEPVAPPQRKWHVRHERSKTTKGRHMTRELVAGAKAPAFTLQRDGGDSVSLSDFKGRNLVLFFYPRADTPGCTKEAIDFSRLSSAFAEHQTAVLGVSADPLKAQEAFRDKHELVTPLVSDEQHEMLEAYGVWGEKSMYGRTFLGTLRTTVLVGSDGRIARIWRNVRVDGHADEVLAAARSL